MPVLTDRLEIGTELHRMLDPRGRRLADHPALSSLIEASPNLSYLFETRPRQMHALLFIPRVECADGLTFSMQADSSLWCSPRNSIGPWQAVEIGLPSRPVAKFEPYRMFDNEPMSSVYGYVPTVCVAEVIAEAGGLVTRGAS